MGQQVETFSTAGLAPHRRIDYWNELAGNVITQLVADPVDPRTFMGTLSCTQLDQIRILEVISDPATVRHCRHHIARQHEPKYFLCLQLDGVSINRQQGRETTLRYGDFTLFDSSRPYEIEFPQQNQSLVLCLPHAELSRRMANPEAVVCIGMPGNDGLTGLLSSFLRGFWKHCCAEGDQFLSPRFSEAILDLVASAYASVPQTMSRLSSLTAARREQIRSFIESSLHDPQLTPGRVAKAMHMSPRYLHHLFEEEGETVSRYILRRRLEECARAISDAAQRGRTVTEIAFQHGFNDASHFGRVFRERYGMSPRDYRRKSGTA
jgi:AraC-like DNA-binding protein